MIVEINGLIKILSRQHKEYTKEQIAEIIEREGASFLNPNIKYLGFGKWEI